MQLFCLTLDINQTDEDIKGFIKTILPICKKTQAGACFSIDGYDDDKREIWQIPEAISFIKKLMKLGFMSILEISTTSPTLVRKELFNTTDLPGFGAIELWLIANDKMEDGANEITVEMLEFFKKDLEKSNGIAESYLVEKRKHSYNVAK